MRVGEKSVRRDLDGVVNVVDELLLSRVPETVPVGTEIHLPDVP